MTDETTKERGVDERMKTGVGPRREKRKFRLCGTLGQCQTQTKRRTGGNSQMPWPS